MLSRRREERRHRERRDLRDLEHGRGDAVAGELLGRRQGLLDEPRRGRDQRVSALAAERRGGRVGGLVGDLAHDVGEADVVEDDRRVAAGERGVEGGVDRRRRARREHPQPRHVLEHGLRRVLVLGGAARARAGHHVERGRRRGGAAREVAHVGRLVHERRPAVEHEARGRAGDERPQARDRGADRRRGDAELADRRQQDAVAEALAQAVVGVEGKRDRAAEHEDLGIRVELADGNLDIRIESFRLPNDWEPQTAIKKLVKPSTWLQKQMKTSDNGMIGDLDGGVCSSKLTDVMSYPNRVKPGHKMVLRLALENCGGR